MHKLSIGAYISSALLGQYVGVGQAWAGVVKGPVLNPASGHLYYLLSQDTWTASEAQASRAGGHLVTINDATENQFVFSNFSTFGGINRDLWIGLSDDAVDRTFVWSSGQPVTYTNWAPGEPSGLTTGPTSDEDYGHISRPGTTTAGKWNDAPNAGDGLLIHPLGVFEVFVPEYKQARPVGDPHPLAWEGQITLNDPDGNTMRQTGCYVTAAAMVADAFGHNVDPGALNIFLRNHTKTGKTGGRFDWNSFPSTLILGTGDSGGPRLKFDSGTALLPAIAPINAGAGRQQVLDELDARIKTNGPVILRVPSRGHGLSGYNDIVPKVHAIVAYAIYSPTGKPTDRQVLIRDPGHEYYQSSTSLDDFVIYFNSGKSAAEQLHNADGSVGGTDYSWLRRKSVGYAATLGLPTITGTAHSPVDFVITDPLGRRLGYNPSTDAYYDEIPGSSYGRAEIAVPEDDTIIIPATSDYADLLYEIGSPVIGTYSVQVFGLANGSWSLDGQIDGSDLFALSGIAQLGSVDSGNFNVSAIPEPSGIAFMIATIVGYLKRRRRVA